MKKQLLFLVALIISTTAMSQTYIGKSTDKTIQRGSYGSQTGIINRVLHDTSEVTTAEKINGLTIVDLSGASWTWRATPAHWMGGSSSGSFIPTAEKGAASGVASLDGSSHVPLAQLPFSTPLDYKGAWNAGTNTPTLANGTGSVGHMYIVSVGGTRNLGAGSKTYTAGDVLVANNTVQYEVIGTVAGQFINGIGYVHANGTVLDYVSGTSSQFLKADGSLDATVYQVNTSLDGTNIVVGSTTGTKIGTATSQKLGFYNATPVTQPSGNILTALQNLGLVASPTIPTVAGLQSMQVYTSSTTYVPTPGTKSILIVGVGAGGGGGSVYSGSTTFAATGGGGSGAVFYKFITTPAASYTLTVGAGGAGGVTVGTTVNAGANGGSSTATDGTTTWTAPGGFGSIGMSALSTQSNTEGADGANIATNGTYNMTGQPGGWAICQSTANMQMGGCGGSTPFGNGGKAKKLAAGVNGAVMGGGGSGTSTGTATSRSGGNGGGGGFFVYEY